MGMMDEENCPVNETLKIISKKWHLHIIRDLFYGKKKFSQFMESNPRITNKVLADTLKDLEFKGIIEKTNFEQNFKSTEYVLTERGKRLNKLIYELGMFSIEDEAYPSEEREESIQILKSNLNID